MDPLRLLEAARDPYLRRHVPSQQAMALATSLSSGQAYYTVESLEGATSLPFLKPAPPAPLPRRESFAPSVTLPADRDALMRLDAQTRALFAEREALDMRTRLLAAEREALLRRNLPGAATSLTDRRLFADGLQPLDGRTRVNADGLHLLDVRTRLSLDGLQNLDARLRVLSHGLEVRPHDTLQPGLGSRLRAPPLAGGLASGATSHGPLSDLIRTQELTAGARSGAPSFLAADPSLVQRDITGHRTEILARSGPSPFLPADSLLSRRDVADRQAEMPEARGQSDHPFTNGPREPVAARPEPVETLQANKQVERNKGPSSSKLPSLKPTAGVIKPCPEESEGWCSVCKIDCHNTKTLGIHVIGKKHKAAVEKLQGDSVKVDETSTGALGKEDSTSVPAATSQADKKRASGEPEALQSAKRPKVPASAVASSAPMASTANATEGTMAKADAKPAAKNVKPNPSHLVCEVCNIFTTGKKNLEIHLKGKRHVARVKELASS
eukprot:c14578_g1_i1 orf=108-1601(+)